MGAWMSFPWILNYCGKRKNVHVTAEEQAEKQPLLLAIDVDDGPNAVQSILDNALRTMVVGLKFTCARELRRKGASLAQLSEAQIERLGDAATRLFSERSIIFDGAKTMVLDPDVLTDVVAPPSLEMVARFLTVAVIVKHMYCSATDPASFYAFARANRSLSVPFARCARLGGVHTTALLEITGWYPSGSPSDVTQRIWPSIHRQLVEEKRRLVRALLDVGADVNAQGGKVFASASSLSGHEIVLEELLRDPSAVDRNAPFFREAMQRFLTSDVHDDDAARVIALFSDVIQQ